MTLYQVISDYGCYGIEVSDNIVTDSAPIGIWMIGKRFDLVES